ncbi:MAG: hypothetical protein AMJ61_07555 [Desulfobacterales bacterium SG8_35_2]|jgi:hypothetical protein|nr:MAG: hypothetical protein AMJ61_07555 [Desulfobacterales bacterium SG8_35_2]
MPTISACKLDFLVDDETKLIGFIAAVLQISEYELFRIAYLKWFDHAISDKRLDTLFKEYLETGEAPFWVNDFARKAHEKFKAGELNYRDYGIRRRVCNRRTKIKGWIIITLLLIFLSAYSYVISRYASY